MNSMNLRNHLTDDLHLSDDQIDDALIGDLAAEHAAHLAVCDECQIRLTEAGAPIASFNAVSLAWSERRSSTLPLRPVPSTGAGAWLPRATWAATAAAVVAVGVAVPVVRHSIQGKATPQSQQDAAQTLMAATGPVDNPIAAREEQIARDNQMLENIDRELTPASSYDQEYGLQTTGSHTSAHAVSTPVRN